MGFANLKKSVESAIKEAVTSDEFKASIKNVVTTTIDESSELIEKIVTEKQNKCDEKYGKGPGDAKFVKEYLEKNKNDGKKDD